MWLYPCSLEDLTVETMDDVDFWYRIFEQLDLHIGMSVGRFWNMDRLVEHEAKPCTRIISTLSAIQNTLNK